MTRGWIAWGLVCFLGCFGLAAAKSEPGGEAVLIEVDGAIGPLTLDRPERLEAAE